MQRSRNRTQFVPAVAIVMTILLVAGAAAAQDQQQQKEVQHPEAQGEALAVKLCANCHVLPGGTPASVPAGVPTFRAIANKPGQTGDHIAQILIRPHAPMPDLQMTRDEIYAILAYLETLRVDPAVKPIAPPVETPSPVMPKKS